MYALAFKHRWDRHYTKLDGSTREQIWKKIQKQKEETPLRHMKYGLEYCIIESGQYRIALIVDEKQKIKSIEFVGNHKQYEKWYKNE